MHVVHLSDTPMPRHFQNGFLYTFWAIKPIQILITAKGKKG